MYDLNLTRSLSVAAVALSRPSLVLGWLLSIGLLMTIVVSSIWWRQGRTIYTRRSRATAIVLTWLLLLIGILTAILSL